MRPCSVSIRLPSLHGAPIDSRPQRETHSPKPFSQPSPPRSDRFTNCGWTISLTGESHPKRSSPTLAVQTLNPRVGTTVNFKAPLSTSMTSTPSCRPPDKVRLVTLQLPALASPPASPEVSFHSFMDTL